MTGLVTPLRVAVVGAVAALATTAALAWVFQDTIGQAMIDPDRSYEAYTPPPPPDYERPDAWLVRGQGSGPADVFYIHANAYHGDGNWNAPHDRSTQEDFIRNVLLPVEAGPFAAYGGLWAPRYRQPTLYARFTQKHPGSASRVTAYSDIRSAFDAFLRDREPSRPFFVVGYGDGALFAGRLFEERIAGNSTLRRQLAALYAIGMPLPEAMFEDEVCGSEDEPRCMIAFTPMDARFRADQTRLRETTLTLAPGGGYASTSGTEELCAPPPLPPRVEAVFVEDDELLTLTTPLDTRCEDGLLIVEPPADRRLRRTRFFGLQWRPGPVNLFYNPLKEDAGRRLEGILRLTAREDNTVPPMASPEDVRRSEINKVPE